MSESRNPIARYLRSQTARFASNARTAINNTSIFAIQRRHACYTNCSFAPLITYPEANRMFVRMDASLRARAQRTKRFAQSTRFRANTRVFTYRPRSRRYASELSLPASGRFPSSGNFVSLSFSHIDATTKKSLVDA